MLFGLLLALPLVIAGGVSLLAARHLDPCAQDGPMAPGEESVRSRSERLAGLVHEGLGRTVQAVDTHVERRPAEELAEEQPVALDDRRAALQVMGSALVVLGVVMALGVVLLFS